MPDTSIPRDFKLEDWLPMSPDMGPPLPEFLGIYWPWYTPPAAEFRVSDLVISPLEVEPGQVVTISCTVTNIGTEAGSYKVELRGDFMAEKEVQLNPGESKTASFEVTPAEARPHSVSVDGLAGTFEAKAPEPEVPSNGIEIYWRDALGNPLPHNSPVTIEEGKTAYFDVYITNTSTKGGEPWPVSFDILIGATYGSPSFLPMMTPIWLPAEAFEGGQRKGPFSGSVTPVLGSADWDGLLTVDVKVGTITVASGSDPIDIIFVPIIYGAIIEL
ncbi:hypothetical protein ES703_55624 [subsurface metagenome]